VKAGGAVLLLLLLAPFIASIAPPSNPDIMIIQYGGATQDSSHVYATAVVARAANVSFCPTEEDLRAPFRLAGNVLLAAFFLNAILVALSYIETPLFGRMSEIVMNVRERQQGFLFLAFVLVVIYMIVSMDLVNAVTLDQNNCAYIDWSRTTIGQIVGTLGKLVRGMLGIFTP